MGIERPYNDVLVLLSAIKRPYKDHCFFGPSVKEHHSYWNVHLYMGQVWKTTTTRMLFSLIWSHVIHSVRVTCGSNHVPFSIFGTRAVHFVRITCRSFCSDHMPSILFGSLAFQSVRITSHLVFSEHALLQNTTHITTISVCRMKCCGEDERFSCSGYF